MVGYLILPMLIYQIIARSSLLLPVDNHDTPFVLLFDESFHDVAAPEDRDEHFNFNFQTCVFDLLNIVLANIAWAFLLRN